ncbi:MAG: RecBCD enzyme subunit RecB [candidate division WS2 bacterium]|nr:RecBCD enzyme subunit RecB [Bacillota bacterium]MBT9150600.1 RecBCD enzyme subunit RecB [Candidatus Psychracetigena formicireducens]
MKVLEYNDLDASKVRRQYEKVVSCLEKNDFRSADVKKLVEHDIYRARLDDTNRLIFKIMNYKGVRYALILEVVLNHAYERSKFLRGVKIDETKISLIEDTTQIKDEALPSAIYINSSDKCFHFLDKIISFDPKQQEVYKVHPPLIIIGPAGSGKTALTLEKMKRFYGQGIYATLSPYLSDNARNIYYSSHYENNNQEISFLSFREFLETMRVPEGKEIRYSAFAQWLLRFPRQQRVADIHRLHEEFRGVITGSIVDKPYLSRKEYLNLGVRQSIYLDNERELVYTLFEKYLAFLKENGFYDPNILAHSYLKDVRQIYDFVVVDEVQDITSIQLQIILRSLKKPDNFILCGDSNQIVHPNFFSWSGLKSMLYNSASLETKKVMRILQSNFRNSKAITEMSNRLIKIKQKRFGSIDKESTYLMSSLSEMTGEVVFLKDINRVKQDLNKNIRRSAKFAVLVMRDEDKALARRFFDTPLIFSIHEAKGLEYENVILLNFISDERQNFQEIIRGVNEEDLEGKIRYMRAADKTDKSLEVYKFFINSLYVAITRAVQKLYIIEGDTGHPILQMLGLRNALEQVSVKTEQSSNEEWQTEARRLELQGKQEQADEIKRTILKTQPVPWDVCTPQRIMSLASQIRTAKDNPQRPRKALFEYALFYDAPRIIEFLSAYGFDKARQIHLMRQGVPFFNWSLYEQQKVNLAIKYLQKYSGNLYKEVIRQCELYGVDHRIGFNATPLIIAARAGNVQLVKELLSAGANIELTDNFGLTAWQSALQRAILDKNFASSLFPQMNGMLAPSSMSLKVDDRLIKLDSSQGEFMLFHIFFVLLPYRFNHLSAQAISLTAIQLSEMEMLLLDSMIAEYRKKRQYISSLLSKNEMDSINPYNKKLFKRKRTGHYLLNPAIQIRQKDEWLDIYSFAGIELISRIISEDKGYFNSLIRGLTTDVSEVKTKKEPNADVKIKKEHKAEQQKKSEADVKTKAQIKSGKKAEALAKALLELNKQGKLY